MIDKLRLGVFFLAFAMAIVSTIYGAVSLVREIPAQTPEDNFGVVLADAGDINGDGLHDLLAGSPGNDFNEQNTGTVIIYLGGSDFKDPSPDIRLTGESSGDRFGIALTALGDINNDGYDDFAVGADRYDYGDESDVGRVYIYLGGKEFSSNPAYKLTGGRANNRFGVTLDGTGDINGDTRRDLLIGESYGGSGYTGAVHLFLGKANIMDWILDGADLVVEGLDNGSLFGEMLAVVGDVNNDNYDDFIVGAYYASTENVSNTGQAYLYKGGSVISDEPWVTWSGTEENIWFGFAGAAVGDVNDDGYADILISAPRAGEEGRGVMYLYKGGPQVRTNPFFTSSGNHPKDLYGYALFGNVDVSGDNISDFLAGAPYDDTGITRGGLVNIFYGGDKIADIADMHISGHIEEEQCGYAITIVQNFYGNNTHLLAVSKPLALLTSGQSKLGLYKITR